VNLGLVQILCFWTLSRFSLVYVNVFFNDVVIFIDVGSLLSCDVRTANYIFLPCHAFFF
jgi:hypothetical protein